MVSAREVKGPERRVKRGNIYRLKRCHSGEGSCISRLTSYFCWSVIQLGTVQYNTIQYNTTQHNTTQHRKREVTLFRRINNHYLIQLHTACNLPKANKSSIKVFKNRNMRNFHGRWLTDFNLWLIKSCGKKERRKGNENRDQARNQGRTKEGGERRKLVSKDGRNEKKIASKKVIK